MKRKIIVRQTAYWHSICYKYSFKEVVGNLFAPRPDRDYFYESRTRAVVKFSEKYFANVEPATDWHCYTVSFREGDNKAALLRTFLRYLRTISARYILINMKDGEKCRSSVRGHIHILIDRTIINIAEYFSGRFTGDRVTKKNYRSLYEYLRQNIRDGANLSSSHGLKKPYKFKCEIQCNEGERALEKRIEELYCSQGDDCLFFGNAFWRKVEIFKAIR